MLNSFGSPIVWIICALIAVALGGATKRAAKPQRVLIPIKNG